MSNELTDEEIRMQLEAMRQEYGIPQPEEDSGESD